jgi:hypothetical protein
MGAFTLDGERRVPLDGRLIALCVIDGDARIELDDERISLRAPDSALVESADPEAEVVLHCNEPAVLVQISFRPPALA